MFENPRGGRQARNFTTNVPKILDLKSSSEQIFFRKLSLGAPVKEDSWWLVFFRYCIPSLIIKMHFYLFECSNTISHWWLNLAQFGEAELKIWILLWVVYWLILSVVQGMSLKIECPWKLTRNVDFILCWVSTYFDIPLCLSMIMNWNRKVNHDMYLAGPS